MSIDVKIVSYTPYLIRPAGPDDAVTLVELVRELARFEHLEEYARATPDDFRTYLFGPHPLATAILAEAEGEAAGFALYYMTFSTFRGEPGIYVEDLYVRSRQRGRGIGKALLSRVASAGAERGGCRLEWSVLKWNTPAIGFYESLGARQLDAWTVYRLDGAPFDRLVQRTPPAPPTS